MYSPTAKTNLINKN